MGPFTLSLSRLPVNTITNFLTGVVRETMTLHATDGTRLEMCLYRPYEVDMGRPDVIPCIVVVCCGQSLGDWAEVMYLYATHGFAVVAFTGRPHVKLNDMFTPAEIQDLSDVHRFVRSQLQWIRSDAMFLLGQSYASGIVLRCLALTGMALYRGGIVLSPIPFVSSLVSEDIGSIPVVSQASVQMIQRQLGVQSVASQQFTSPSTPSDLRAQRILVIDQAERAAFVPSNITVPLYVHVNIGDSVVNIHDTVTLFALLAPTQPRSCIRYVHGDHGISETAVSTRRAIYDDVLQWCRAILHDGSIKTYQTEVRSTATGTSTVSAINPASDALKYTITDNKKLVCATTYYLPVLLVDRILQHLVHTYIPLRPLLRLHRDIIWSRVFTRSLDIAGFPVVSLLVHTTTPASGFGLTLLEYDRTGRGKRLSYKYILVPDTPPGSVPAVRVCIRMSMVSARLQCGQELVLVVSNYDSRFAYTGRTDATIEFTEITLPYLFEF